MTQAMGAHLNTLMKALEPGVRMDGVVGLIQKELNTLHLRIDQLEKRIEHVPYKMSQLLDFPYTQRELATLIRKVEDEFTTDLNKSKVTDEELIGSIFGEETKANELPKESKNTGPLHPATNSSFVLKI